MSSGPLNRPKLPAIPGIEKFKGHTFHTSRWDYDYTGGDTTGGLHKLNDKRVGIIGTGATAIQCVPHLGEHAQAALRVPAHAVLGGRTQQQADRSGMGEDAQARMAGLSQPQLLRPLGRDPASRKIWSATSGRACSRSSASCSQARSSDLSDEEMALLAEIADFQKMNEIRGRVASTVSDPADGRGAQAVVRAMVQAPDLQRRVPAHLQPAQREAGGHQGQGCRSRDRERSGRGRRRVRSGLPDLRDGLRGGDGVHAARRVRDVRPQRRVSLRLLGEGDEDLPRFPEPRFPELLPHGAHADRPGAELHLHAGRAGQPHRPAHHAGECSQREVDRADPRGRGGVGEDGDRSRPS